ncbi:hypothetical protein Aple_038220 [Acrocarpospora pleiomorpha]|uniref:Uncharacterized protein n=1 Tax=Acrocarpospora pleiomorpha TaxID=90975 RepID=A0A5M3XJP0_9ACTN|nr:hypothetical protein Aple_038220 [Acrocarpospora pleiomorpha]
MNVPGKPVGIPNWPVTMPGRLVTLPGRPVGMSGRVVTLLGRRIRVPVVGGDLIRVPVGVSGRPIGVRCLRDSGQVPD